MPKLPSPSASDAEAMRIARVLAGKTQSNDAPVFGAVVREWLRENPEQTALFIAWYENRPDSVSMRK